VKNSTSTVWESLNKARMRTPLRGGWAYLPQFCAHQAEAILECDFFHRETARGNRPKSGLDRALHQRASVSSEYFAFFSNAGVDRPRRPELIRTWASRRPRSRLMIRDRGSNYTAAFDAVLADAGIRDVLCPVRTAPVNAIAERLDRAD